MITTACAKRYGRVSKVLQGEAREKGYTAKQIGKRAHTGRAETMRILDLMIEHRRVEPVYSTLSTGKLITRYRLIGFLRSLVGAHTMRP